jgi:hypothetical protein
MWDLKRTRDAQKIKTLQGVFYMFAQEKKMAHTQRHDLLKQHEQTRAVTDKNTAVFLLNVCGLFHLIVYHIVLTLNYTQ